ncbi:MAG: SDR family NAD(P)-dependent oxidoreductase [Lachnospiraceae bacterium]|nr:SDR family NAD(P)-dependent oxidoreductase [Lachnospiraceae bacterium]
MVAVVTGASDGIGMEMAKILGSLGFDLILAARREKELSQLCYAIAKKFHVSAQAFVCDLSKEEDCRRLHAYCKGRDVRVFINNAGRGVIGPFLETDLDAEMEMLRLNILSTHLLFKLFSGSMENGFILNVASMAAFQETPLMAAYGATKAYLYHLSSSVNYEFRKQGKPVHVATLCPGSVATGFDKAAGVPHPLSGMSASECAEAAIYGMFRGRSVIIPGTKEKLARLAVKLLPREIILPMEYRIQGKKLGIF